MGDHDDKPDRAATYRNAVAMSYVAYRTLLHQPLGELLRDIGRAEALGPLVDPTLWRDKHKAMGQDRELLAAAKAFVDAVKKAGFPAE